MVSFPYRERCRAQACTMPRDILLLPLLDLPQLSLHLFTSASLPRAAAKAAGVARRLELVFLGRLFYKEDGRPRIPRGRRRASSVARVRRNACGLPSGVIAQVCEFKDDEWDKVPLDRRQAILSRHLGSYSAGTLSSCRHALTRLGRWLETNGFSKQRVTWECSGGLLSWFVQDEQEKSRSLR